MDSFLVGAQILLAGIFALSGTAKLFDRAGTRQAVRDFGAPAWAAPVVAVALPLVELGIAVALLFHPTARWGALAALLLLLIFIAGVANALRQGKDVDCGCFGRVYSATAGTATLIRNAALAALALFLVVKGPAPALDGWVSERSAAELVAIVLTIVVIPLAAVVWWLWDRTRKLEVALDDARRRVVVPEGLPRETLAPTFALPDKHSEIHTLDSALARGKRVVMVFMDAGCAPCKRIGPRLARWQSVFADRLTLVVVSAGSREQGEGVWDEHGIDALFDAGDQLARAYAVRSFPSALIVEPDGRIGSMPANGGHGVEVLMRVALSDEEPAARAMVESAGVPSVLQVEPGTL